VKRNALLYGDNYEALRERLDDEAAAPEELAGDAQARWRLTALRFPGHHDSCHGEPRPPGDLNPLSRQQENCP